jgi:hypothetical protein
MGNSPRWLAVATLALCALVAAACGSTVQQTALEPVGQSEVAADGFGAVADDGLSVPDGATVGSDVADGLTPPVVDSTAVPGSGGVRSGAPAADATAAAPSAPSARAAPSTPGATAPRGGGAGSTGGAQAPPAAPQGGTAPSAPAPGSTGSGSGGRSGAPTASAARGVTDEEVRIGITFLSDRDQANESLVGGAVPSTGDRRSYFETLVAWANANGGLAGRKVAPVYRSFDSAEALADEEALTQSICTFFTQDHDVYAVWAEDSTTQLVDYLAKEDVLVFGSDGMPYHDERGFAALRSHLFYSSTFNLFRVARTMAQGLVAQGFLTPENTIGAVVLDEPQHRRAHNDDYKRALAEAGLEVTEEVFVAADIDTIGQQVNNAILRFRSRGIDRVTFLEATGLLYVTWTRSAESQAYRPRYGLNSSSYPEALKGLIPPEQLAGTRGVVWNPAYDLAEQGEPAVPPRRDACLRIMADAGLNPEGRAQVGAMSQTCDQIFFSKSALDRATNLSPAGIEGIVNGLGQAYEPALQLAAFHGPGHHDGAGAYVFLRYDEACTCFVADGGLQAVER